MPEEYLNKLQETVDLFELVISRTMDLSFFIHNSQIHQEWNRSSFLQYILFHTIVCPESEQALSPDALSL